MSVNKSWVLITGAKGDIGNALVSQFEYASYNVIAIDKLWKHSRFRNENIYELGLDLSNVVNSEEAMDQLGSQIDTITNGAGLSALINNAAVQILGNADTLSKKAWMDTWDVNLHVPFLLIQQFLTGLEKNKGAVVNISSIHATSSKRNFVAYATSKSALSSLTRNLALDIGDRIRINAIEPAAIRTKMLTAGFERSPEKLNSLSEYHPMCRIGEPNEVAELAVFLCSDRAKFIQGSCIQISGGIHARLYDPD